MGLATGQTQLCQYVKNLLALDFHLACEIVDTNLTHPPLFGTYLRALGAHKRLVTRMLFQLPVNVP